MSEIVLPIPSCTVVYAASFLNRIRPPGSFLAGLDGAARDPVAQCGSYGNFGNWVKSGTRFSLNASRPSFASSEV